MTTGIHLLCFMPEEEDRQGDRHGLTSATGSGQQLQGVLCLIGFLPFLLY